MSSLFSSFGSNKSKFLKKNNDDVVIVYSKRTPLCKARKGSYKDMTDDEFLVEFYTALKATLPIDTDLIEDVTFGTVNTPNSVFYARATALAAGFSENTSFQTINRFCSSGLMAVTGIANQIRNGEIDIGLAIGYENMTNNNEGRPVVTNHPSFSASQPAEDCKQPMGWTSENVARDFNLTRERLDDLASQSYQRAERAQKEGIFGAEILPIGGFAKGPDGEKKPIKITKDDGIRYGTTKESLGKIRAAFPQWGPNTTGGNASQVTDGAAAVLLMRRSKAIELGLPILAKHVLTTVAGLAPRIMGIGPSLAIPKLLEKTGLTKDDIELWEVNEAFATMFSYMIDVYGLPHDKTNVNGGAIALGHPLGATGARQVATGLNAIRSRKQQFLVTSMCIGSGMGAAALFIAEY